MTNKEPQTQSTDRANGPNEHRSIPVTIRASALTIGVIVVVGGLAAAVGSLARTKTSQRTPPPIPVVQLEEMQPLVTDIFRDALAAVRAAPESGSAWGHLGAVFDAHEQTESAVQCYTEAMALEPNKFRWIYHLAFVQETQGATAKEVVGLFERAAATRPGYAPVFARLGKALARFGKLEDARDAYRVALRIAPTFAMCHLGIGQVYLSLGENEKALEHLQQVQTLSPEDSVALISLSQAYMRLGQPDRARVLSDQARTLGRTVPFPDPVHAEVSSLNQTSHAALQRATQKMEVGDFSGALPDLVAFVGLHPTSPYGLLRLARCCLRTGRLTDAMDYFAKAQKAGEELSESPEEQHALEATLGQLDDALWDFRRERLEVLTASLEGEALRNEIETLESAARDRLDLDPRTLLTLGNAFFQMDDLDGAVEQWTNCLKADPTYVNALVNLAVVYEKQGRMQDAANAYLRAVDLQPNHPSLASLAHLAGESP